MNSYQPWHLKNIYNREFINILIDKDEDLSFIPGEEDIEDYLINDEDEQHINRVLDIYYMKGTKYTIPVNKKI